MSEPNPQSSVSCFLSVDIKNRGGQEISCCAFPLLRIALEKSTMSSESEPTTSSSAESSSENMNTEKVPDEFLEPETKRRRMVVAINEKKYKLEDRLGGILCCAVCLDLPRTAIYQCSNGHLMCSGCFTHVLADARLRDETSTCPTCRVEISKTSATRNLAVESTIAELPSECQFCNKQYPRNFLTRHEEEECEERISGCKYRRIGCPWKGPDHERMQHEQECGHANKTGAEIMEALDILDQRVSEERKLYKTVFELLGYDRITFNDILLKPYRTDDFVHRLFYESSRFSAFGQQWVVKAKISDNQKDPTQSSERDMTYQLILRSKISTPMTLSYLAVCGPGGDIKVNPRVYKFNFTENDSEATYESFPLPDTTECNRLLAAKTISFRLFMFLASN